MREPGRDSQTHRRKDERLRGNRRKDFKTLSRRFGDELLDVFAAGDKDTKIAVADLFEQPASAATMTVEELKKAMKYDEAVKTLEEK